MNETIKPEEKPKVKIEEPEETVEWQWDQRNYKLTRIINRKEKMGKGHLTTKTVQVFDRNAVKTLRDNVKKQYNNMKLFFELGKKARELNENKDKLPMFKEVRDVLNSLRWEQDNQFKMQFLQCEKDIKKTEEDYENIKRLVPQNL